MTIARYDLPGDATWQRAWSVANLTEAATLLATTGPNGPKRGDVIIILDTGFFYLVIKTGVIKRISDLATAPVSLSSDVVGVLPTEFGGTAVDIATAALPLGFGQIAFPVTQNPSSNANILDDYEEGTWTPRFGGNGGESGQVYSTQSGVYIKVGRLCLAWFEMTLSTLGTITGGLIVKGFPFTSANLATGVFGTASAFWNNWVVNQNVVQINMAVNSTQAFVIRTTAASVGIPGQPTSADLGTVSALRACVPYLTAA